MSTQNLQQIWEIYAASWKANSADEKLALFGKSLDHNCEYHDPVVNVQGWDALKDYMLDFHRQLPGGHFVTKCFQTHDNKCIAIWDMKTGDGQTVTEGMSYGEFTSSGKLRSMTGFFELPEG